MTEIHAFDPDGTPSPGAQTALDAAVAAIPESVLDPQIAAYVADSDTEIASAGDARWAPQAVAAAPDERSMLNRVKVRAVLDYRDTNDVYPQAFAYNPDEGHWYLGTQPDTSGGAKFYRLYRINAETGARVDYVEFPMPQNTWCEGFHYWRGADGRLRFAVMNTPADSDNDSAYSILDYEAGTLGEPVPIRGKTRMNRVGDYIITTDSPATALRSIFVYDRASVEAGAPTLLSTIPLLKPGYVAKLQGLVGVGSTLFFTQGAVDSVPSVSGFDWSGREVITQQYRKSDLGRLINEHTPGTIADPDANFGCENEGAWADQGHLLTGMAVNSGAAGRFVILEHSRADGTALSITPLVEPGAWTYNEVHSGIRVKLVREGKTVVGNLVGSFDSSIADGATRQITSSPIPVVFRPETNTRVPVSAGGGEKLAVLFVTAGGNLQVLNGTGATIGSINGAAVSYRVDL